VTVYPVGEWRSALTVAPFTIAGLPVAAAGAATMKLAPSVTNASNEIARVNLRLAVTFLI
jgi:hypothetical protein